MRTWKLCKSEIHQTAIFMVNETRNTTPQLAEGILVDLWRDFWIRETGTGQQVAQLHDRYMMMMMMMKLEVRKKVGQFILAADLLASQEEQRPLHSLNISHLCISLRIWRDIIWALRCRSYVSEIQGDPKAPVRLCKKGIEVCCMWGVPYIKPVRWNTHLCHIPLEVTSNPRLSRTFTDLHFNLHPASDRYTGTCRSSCTVIPRLTSDPANEFFG